MLEYNGKQYARVSEIISQFADFDGIPKNILGNKAAIGTKVHQAIDDFIKGDFPFVDKETAPYVESFQQWVDIAKPRWVESEVRHYDDQLLITGCIDALATFQANGETFLIDFKTSVQESPTWVLQAHLYHLLLEKANKSIAPSFIFIKLDKLGMQPRSYRYQFNIATRQKCIQAVRKFWKERDVLI